MVRYTCFLTNKQFNKLITEDKDVCLKCCTLPHTGIALQAMLLYLLYTEGVAPGYSDTAFQAFFTSETLINNGFAFE